MRRAIDDEFVTHLVSSQFTFGFARPFEFGGEGFPTLGNFGNLAVPAVYGRRKADREPVVARLRGRFRREFLLGHDLEFDGLSVGVGHSIEFAEEWDCISLMCRKEVNHGLTLLWAAQWQITFSGLKLNFQFAVRFTYRQGAFPFCRRC